MLGLGGLLAYSAMDASTTLGTASFSKTDTFTRAVTPTELTKTISETEKASDDNDRGNFTFIAVLVSVGLILLIALISIIYLRHKRNSEPEVAYTKAILGDDAFEFSQLETI